MKVSQTLLFLYNIITVVVIFYSCDKPVIAWPIERVANYSGNLLLGALFPIHARDEKRICGPIQEYDGIRPFEAMMFVLRKINMDNSILPGITLGVLALDSCDSETHALEQGLDFIKGFIVKSHQDRVLECSDGSKPKPVNSYNDFERIIGVIEGASSAISIQLANLLRLFKLPQISFMATTPSLSNLDRFDYFLRTVPSDINQAYAIVQILREFSWTYVSAVFDDTDYGTKGFGELEELAAKYNICIAVREKITLDTISMGPHDYDYTIHELRRKSRARVVVVFGDHSRVQKLFQAAKRNKANDFVWIGSDAWSGRYSVAAGQEEIVEGSITIQPLIQELAEFDDYFVRLRPSNNNHNPWFVEFWEDKFHCKFLNSSETPFNTNMSKVCTGNENLTFSVHQEQNYLHFIRDAIYAYAFALHDMHKNKCHGKSGLCPEMQSIKGEELKRYLQKVVFKDENNKSFHFVNGTDGPPRYTILNFQKNVQGTYVWRPVGSYTLGENMEPVLDINKSLLRFRLSELWYPESYCSLPCAAYQAKNQQQGDVCCWICTNCSEFQYLYDEYHCEDCPLGQIPNQLRTTCVPIPEEFIDYESAWALGALLFAGIGILSTVIIAVIFCLYIDTPLIKASGRELSFCLLFGIFLSHVVSFILVSKPTTATCAATRFFMGFCYALCYASILTKTNRIARIFNQGRNTPQKPRYTSPKSQLIILAGLCLVEVLISVLWLTYCPPGVTHIYPTRVDSILVCTGSDNASYLVGLIYPVFLIALCTVYAFKTRKCPDGFNEARHIAFTNYTTCIIWLAFVPLFFASTNNAIRIVTLSVSMGLSGMVQLACLFVPKVYIVLFRPEKNTKEGVMTTRRSSLHNSSLAASTSGITLTGSFMEALAVKNRAYLPNTSSPLGTGSTLSPTHFINPNMDYRMQRSSSPVPTRNSNAL